DVLYWRGPRAAEWLAITHDPRYRWSPGNTTVNALLESRTGVIWIGTEEGLLRVVPDHAAQGLVAAWESPRVVNRMFAFAGDVLLATNGAGVLRLDTANRLVAIAQGSRVERDHAVEPGRPEGMVNDLAVVGDRLLLGTKAGVRYVPEPRGTSPPGIAAPESRPRGKYILQVLVDARGTTWMLTRHHGLWWLGADETQPHQFKVPGNPQGAIGRIVSIAAHATGGVICGTTDGIVLWVDERGERGRAPVLSDGSHPGISALAVGPAGSRWIGLDDGRLVLSDSSGNAERVWTEASGLPGGTVHAIQPSGRGRVWVLADGGIARVRAKGSVEPIALLEHWGRPTSILADSDGALLVACSNAIIRLRPSALPARPSAPRAAIAAVLGGGAHLPTHPFSTELEVPYDKRSLSVRVSSLGAGVPERALLRYRLNPDRPWIELGTSRTIDLPDLREGRYAIEFALLGRDDQSARLLLTIRPPWFRSTAAIIAATALLL
ncbi:MAG: two-component regulator propeller domain-containing protein, partial [Flavobacteriales bacterium]